MIPGTLRMPGGLRIPSGLRAPGGLPVTGTLPVLDTPRARVGFTVSLVLLGGFFAPPTAHAQSAREIIDRVDRLMRGESSIARFTMDIRTEHWDRSLTLRAWSLGTEHALIRVETPQKEAGTATLRADQ